MITRACLIEIYANKIARLSSRPMKQDLISLPPLVSYYPRNEPSNETISFRQDGIAPGLLARLHIEFRLDGETVRIRYLVVFVVSRGGKGEGRIDIDESINDYSCRLEKLKFERFEKCTVFKNLYRFVVTDIYTSS